MRVDLVLECAVENTPRVVQTAGIFDVPPSEKSRVEFHFDVPIEERPWQIGLIVGPSGAGKSSVAKHIFGPEMVSEYDWPAKRAIVDGFGELGIRETTAALNSVGFSSPPNWVRPYHVLSNGERFRANMARAIVDPRQRVVVDEYTSVIDRQVAQVGSHAIQKAVRAQPGKQLVAVTCHYDVEEWLQPDWVLEPHLGQFAWRSLRRRPPLDLKVVRVAHDAWRLFAPHHYLSASLHRSARCFLGLVNGTPAAFAGVLHFPHPRRDDIFSLSRVVVLPEFQGLGLGAYAFTETIARIVKANGGVLSTHPSHPALVKAWAKSSLWDMRRAPDFSHPAGKTSGMAHMRHATARRVAHFHYCGPGFETEAERRVARALW